MPLLGCSQSGNAAALATWLDMCGEPAAPQGEPGGVWVLHGSSASRWSEAQPMPRGASAAGMDNICQMCGWKICVCGWKICVCICVSSFSFLPSFPSSLPPSLFPSLSFSLLPFLPPSSVSTFLFLISFFCLYFSPHLPPHFPSFLTFLRPPLCTQ